MSELKIPKNLKMIISDFDGVMTDNCLYFSEDMKMSRKINFKDIMGLALLKRNGIDLCFISGENNKIMEMMKERFALKEIHQNIRKKIDVLKDILDRYNLSPDEILYIGDDINDKECLEFVGTKITVPHAVSAIKNIKGIQITNEQAGSGAFREVVDCLLSF